MIGHSESINKRNTFVSNLLWVFIEEAVNIRNSVLLNNLIYGIGVRQTETYMQQFIISV